MAMIQASIGEKVIKDFSFVHYSEEELLVKRWKWRISEDRSVLNHLDFPVKGLGLEYEVRGPEDNQANVKH